MKIRLGFVSNSSSSSFVCDICGDIKSRDDCDSESLPGICCPNGHMFCYTHVFKYREEYGDGLPDKEDLILHNGVPGIESGCFIDDDWETVVFPKFCPICTGETPIPAHEIYRYMMASLGKNAQEITNQIRLKEKISDDGSGYEEFTSRIIDRLKYILGADSHA